jgi:beta-ribofuranosylaminobenzene 5'-phosphate synthase
MDVDVRDLAAATGRGRRSGVGIAAFQAGGFVIDAGRHKDRVARDVAPTVVWRRDFPADWRFVVVVPAADRGLSGHSEEGVFGRLVPSVRISEEVCRITQLRVMPALVEHDIEEFGRALTALDRKTGAYFSGAQGGLYSGSETNAAIDALLTAGAHGAGQSSWGPAVYGVVHERDAGRVEVAVRRSLSEAGEGARVFVSHGRNTEARMESQSQRTGL